MLSVGGSGAIFVAQAKSDVKSRDSLLFAGASFDSVHTGLAEEKSVVAFFVILINPVELLVEHDTVIDEALKAAAAEPESVDV
jgi:hypothetical protein